MKSARDIEAAERLVRLETRRKALRGVLERLRSEGRSKFLQDAVRGLVRAYGELEDAEIESWMEGGR